MVYKINFGFNTNGIKCAWEKYQLRSFLSYCQLYIFKICASWHAIFRRKHKRIDLPSINGFGNDVRVFSYWKHPVRSSIDLWLYQIVAYQMLQTYLLPWLYSLNVLYTFKKVKKLYFLLKFCVFQFTNSTCIHNNICFVFASEHPHEICALI